MVQQKYIYSVFPKKYLFENMAASSCRILVPFPVSFRFCFGLWI